MNEKTVSILTLVVVGIILVVELRIASKLQSASDTIEKPLGVVQGFLAKLGL